MGEEGEREPLLVLVARLADKDGVSNLAAKPGIWRREIDARWTIYLNAHDTAQPGPMGVDVPAHWCLVEFNGWPAGLFSAGDGWIAAGRLANEETFVEAIRRAITREV